MMPYQTYQLFEAGRSRTTAWQRAEDARRGAFAAAVSRSTRASGARVRALAARRPRWGRPARPAAQAQQRLQVH
jgi:hypothetical protein